jgi:hypothetical protein
LLRVLAAVAAGLLLAMAVAEGAFGPRIPAGSETARPKAVG